MATFNYKARNASGELTHGKLEAASAKAAARSLMSAGMIPVDIKEVRSGVSTSESFNSFFQSKVRLDALLIMCRQMSSLTRAGIPVIRIVEGLRDTTENKVLSKVLSEAVDGLNQGKSLGSALGEHPRIFNSLFISLVEVGESTGQLESAFLQLAHYYQLELDTRRRIKTAMRYPMFVCSAMLIALVVMNIYVIPVFSDLFEDLGADLPLATRILIASSDFFKNYLPHMFAVIALVGFLLFRYVKTEKGRLHWHSLLLRIPIIGPLIKRILLARFCRSFSMMLGAGVPVVQVIGLAGNATGNAYLTLHILAMGEQLAQGAGLTAVARHSGIFTPLILQMLRVGEETGQVDEMVMEAGKFYEEEVDYDISSLTSKIEPILISVISVMVLILALGIFTPMWDMVIEIAG